MSTPWPISRLFRQRAEHSRARGDVDRTTLIDYRLSGVDIDQIDRYFEQVGFPRRMPAGNFAHLAGQLDDELVLIGLWSSERAARQTFATVRPRIDAIMAEAGPRASIDRQSHPAYRFLLGEEIGDFREGRAQADPNCVGYVIDLPTTDSHAYHLICDHMDFPRDYPEGLLLHVAGHVGDVWRVISVWRHASQSREFFEKRLMPAAVEVVREHGVFPEIRPRELRVHLFAVNKRLVNER